MSAVALSVRPVATSTAWLWVPVLGVGLATLLVGPVPSSLDALARPAAARLIHGSFAMSATEAAALAATIAWLALKPLALIGALLFLEVRFGPETDRGDLVQAWIVQALAIGFAIFFRGVLFVLELWPDPLFTV